MGSFALPEIVSQQAPNKTKAMPALGDYGCNILTDSEQFPETSLMMQ